MRSVFIFLGGFGSSTTGQTFLPTVSPSTRYPEALGEIVTLRRLTQALAMLEAILCPEWQYRFYSFNSRWAPGAQMASMRDGCGDEWFLLFGPAGAALKGLAHESVLAQQAAFAARIQQVVPPEFGPFLREAAFAMDRASFCLWRRHPENTWNVVLPDGGLLPGDGDSSAGLLAILDGNPATYRGWARDYHEREVTLAAVRAIYGHTPLGVDLLLELNSDLTLGDVAADAAEIGYPLAPPR